MKLSLPWSFPSFFLIALLALTACGVKGPPLPPVAGDPVESEREDRAVLATPSPTPSPSPVLKKRSVRKK